MDASATVVTDGLPAYKHVGKAQPHLSVNHSDREYARTSVRRTIIATIITAVGPIIDAAGGG